MTIKIYVDWRNEEVLTEKEYDERAREFAEGFGSSDDDFSEFLERNYSHRELWEADEEERANIMERWASECLDAAYCELDYEELKLEV